MYQNKLPGTREIFDLIVVPHLQTLTKITMF